MKKITKEKVREILANIFGQDAETITDDRKFADMSPNLGSDLDQIMSEVACETQGLCPANELFDYVFYPNMEEEDEITVTVRQLIEYMESHEYLT